MASGRRFLLYFKDSLYKDALADQLAGRPETAAVIATNDEEDALDKAAKDFFDAIIVDENLTLSNKLRANGYTGSIILLGGTESEPQDSLDVSDFIVKPFRFSAFLARLHQSILSRESKDINSFVVGVYSFDPKARTAKSNLDGTIYQLTEKEADILTYLYRTDGKVVDKEVLLKEIWGYNAEVSTHTLETHIYRLRKKIDTDEKDPLIVSENGGYRINQGEDA